MVEHLLCKQGVIGSNPIVSTSVALAGWWRPGLCWCGHWFGFMGEGLGSVCALARAVCFVLWCCKSGSGALLGAQDAAVASRKGRCVRCPLTSCVTV